MTSAKIIRKLTADLEAGEANDRDIARALDWRLVPQKGSNLPYWVEPNGNRHTCIPEWTTSIDAALTLVPEGDYDQNWSKSSRGHSEGFKLWQIRLSLETTTEDPEETGPVVLGEAAIPALALCIASLKARIADDTD